MADQPVQPASEHDGCAASASAQSPPAHAPGRLDRLSTPAAVGAAILSSACCWLPLLLLAFGLSAGGVAGFFESVRPYFLAAAVVFLGAGFYFAYIRKPACKPGDACALPDLKIQRFNRAMFGVATVFVIVLVLFPYYSPALVRAFADAPAGATTASGGTDSAATATTRVFDIEGMTCAACAATLEVRLAKLPGVFQAQVSFDEGAATIRSDPHTPSAESLRAAIEGAGFKMAQK